MKKFLKVGEVAEMCGVCSKTVRKFVDSKKISSFRSAKNYRLVPMEEALRLRDILINKKIGASMRSSIDILTAIDEAGRPMKDMLLKIKAVGNPLMKAIEEAEAALGPIKDLMQRANTVLDQYNNINKRRV